MIKKKKWIRFFLFILILPALILSRAEAEGVNPGKEGVVLVLSGGGTRGFAHVGVIQVLEKEGIPLAGIVGTSMGSIVGGLAACGYSGEELEDIIREIDLRELLNDRSETAGQGGITPGEKSLMRLEFDRSWRITGPLGGLEGRNLMERLYMLTRRASVYSFQDLPIPFAAVATDIETGEAVVLNSGDLVSAMRASISIPALFEPWEIRGRLLVDGGLVANVPVSQAKELFPGHPVIVVDVTSRGKTREQIRTVLDVIDQMITVMTDQNVEEALKEADVVIKPDVGTEAMLSTRGWDEIIARGRYATQASMTSIRAVMPKTTERIEKGKVKALPVITDVRIEGLEGYEKERLLEICREWKQKPMNAAEVDRVCRNLRERENIKFVECFLEDPNAEETAINLVVRKKPPREISVSGYASNLDPYRRLYVDLANRDVFTQGDFLNAGIGVGDEWEAYAEYLGRLKKEKQRTGLFLYSSSEKRETASSGIFDWEQYRAAFGEHFYWSPYGIYVGYMVQEVDYRGSHNNHGPLVSMKWNNMDDPIDPTRGLELSGVGWYTDDTLLGRVEVAGVEPLNDTWKFFVKGGAIFGDKSEPWTAAYLGARNELYSRADHPLKGENALWAGIGFRRLFKESWWGRMHMDIFATGGRIYRDGWDVEEDVWEAGLGFTLPGRFLNGRIFIVYDDESEWSFGYSLGQPRHYRTVPSP